MSKNSNKIVMPILINDATVLSLKNIFMGIFFFFFWQACVCTIWKIFPFFSFLRDDTKLKLNYVTAK